MKPQAIYTEITDAIVTALEKGVRPWEQCYRLDAPLRASGEPYKGINVLRLWVEAVDKGYSSSIWMTFKQAKELGANVIRGQKGTRVVYFKTMQKENPRDENKVVSIPMLKSYIVFNLDQIENLPDDFVAVDTVEHPSIDEAERFFSGLPVTLENTTGVPCFVPSADVVRMPQISRFASSEQYYGTYGHECIHWTGHKSRLDRLADKSKKGYAFEELVAEIGSAFLLPRMGIEPLIDDEHAPYISGFLTLLKDDPKAIFKAASQAQKAADYLLSLSQAEQLEKAA